MNDEDITLHDDMRAAGEARQVLENSAFMKAFDELEKDYIGALLQAGAKDDEHRYRRTVAVNVLRGVRAHLTAVINDGEFAKSRLEEIGRVKPLKKRKII